MREAGKLKRHEESMSHKRLWQELGLLYIIKVNWGKGDLITAFVHSRGCLVEVGSSRERELMEQYSKEAVFRSNNHRIDSPKTQ